MNQPSRFKAPRSKPIRVALVGCGAVTTGCHLPVLAGHDSVTIAALVDPDRARASALAGQYGGPTVLSSIDELTTDHADAAVIATPAALHAAHAQQLIGRGLHVLVEKPMALSASDARAIVDAADRAGVVLGVGLFRRLLPAVRLFRAALDAGQVGDVLSIDAEVGSTYTWQLTTMAGMMRQHSGGGALADMGPHVVDLMLYICNGVPEFIEYADNGNPGIETESLAKFVIRTAKGLVPARLELSRTRNLRNSIRVEGTQGVVEWTFGERYKVQLSNGRVLVDPVRGTPRPGLVEARWRDEVEQGGLQGFRDQFDDWISAIEEGRDPELSGRSVVPSVELQEACYRSRTDLQEPWFAEPLPPALHDIPAKAKRVLVTGASGFIGCRLSEMLHFGSDWTVRGLIRNPSRAARLARMPLEFAIGDLGSQATLRAALEGCDAVVHAGIGTSWKRSERVSTNVQGTKRLIDAAVDAGVRRFVHCSTIALYGDAVTGTITEDTPARPKKGWDYAESKLAAEDIVRHAGARGLEVVILRIAVVYGPFNMTVTVRPLEALADGRLVLVECADVPSNTIYVDNLCGGIQGALEAPSSVSGETFLLSDDDGCTWGDYFGFFADHLGRPLRHEAKTQHTRPPKVESSKLGRWFDSTRDVIVSAETKALAKKVFNSDPWGTPARWFIDRFPGPTSRLKQWIKPETGFIFQPAPRASTASPFVVDPIHASVSAEKARRMLGFEPVVTRERALALTLDWARFARVVPSSVSVPSLVAD
jgi:predicted dehydrogenase/nucleoside-diphosphate-sugar epimerase